MCCRSWSESRRPNNTASLPPLVRLPSAPRELQGQEAEILRFGPDQSLSMMCDSWTGTGIGTVGAAGEARKGEAIPSSDALAAAFAFAVCSALDRGSSASGDSGSPSALRRDKQLAQAFHDMQTQPTLGSPVPNAVATPSATSSAAGSAVTPP